MRQIINTEHCLITMATSSHLVKAQVLLCDPGYNAKRDILANMLLTAKLVGVIGDGEAFR